MATPTPGPGPLQTGKGRASRIPLNYFKQLNGLEKTKLGLTVVALVLTGAWLAWGLAQPGGGSLRYSHGPVTLAHASLESNCEACHVPFSPISEQNLFLKHPSKADGKCLDCHSKSDNLKQMTDVWVVHHTNIKPESGVSCAGCHREHQGRDSSLVRLKDNDCTSCHKDLKEHMKSGEKATFANTVKDFATHPEFGGSGGIKNPEKLKFNHYMHLNFKKPGEVKEGQAVGYPLGTIKNRDPAAYDRYCAGQEDKSDSALVQLQCASCHVPQTGGHGASEASGRYMQPTTYDRNCKACHPLTFDAAVTDREGRAFALPHGKLLAETEGLLEFEYLRAIRVNPAAFSRPKAPRPLPGKSLDEVIEKLDPAAEQELARTKASAATRYLEGKAGCGECHAFEGNAIKKVEIPKVWFARAKFSHAAHTEGTMKTKTATEACLKCHAAAETSSDNMQVLLPDAKICKTCHGPARSDGGQSLGGVRSECTLCHTYHHGPESNAAASLRGRDLEFAEDWRRLMGSR
jgi:predicted CXXCH cytochrome family protein